MWPHSRHELGIETPQPREDTPASRAALQEIRTGRVLIVIGAALVPVGFALIGLAGVSGSGTWHAILQGASAAAAIGVGLLLSRGIEMVRDGRADLHGQTPRPRPPGSPPVA